MMLVLSGRWQFDHCVSPNPHPHPYPYPHSRSDLLHLERPVTRSVATSETEITVTTTVMNRFGVNVNPQALALLSL